MEKFMRRANLFFTVLIMFFSFSTFSSAQRIGSWGYLFAEGGVNSPYKIDGLLGNQTLPSWHPYFRGGIGVHNFGTLKSLSGSVIEFGFGYSRFAHDSKDTGTSYAANIAGIDTKLGYILGIPELHFELNTRISLNAIWNKSFPSIYRIHSEHMKNEFTFLTAGIDIGIAINSIVSNKFGFSILGGYRYTNGFILTKKADSSQSQGQFYLGLKLMFGRVDRYADSDGDGIDDNSEMKIYKTDPEKRDTDNDRLSDLDELFKYNTNPLVADTDGDGISDYDECVRHGTSATKTDTDNDGISDSDELYVYKTDPLSVDTDGDGVSDGDEVKAGTSPISKDSDGDGLDDEIEIKRGTNPTLADTDGDGLNDKYELDRNMNALLSDSDGDGLSDKDEIEKGSNPLLWDTDKDGVSDGEEIFIYFSNPLLADTDGDGMTDGDEKQKGTSLLLSDTDSDKLSDYQEVYVYSTNPLLQDTDGSGVDDKTEVERGTDPVDIEDDIIEVDKVIVLEGIEFEFKKATITPESDRRLQKTLKLLQAFPDYKFSLEGHTDDVGSRQFNQKLSVDRAKAVKTWLVNNGIDANRLAVKGFGFDKPIATNSTEEGRQRNRRVEFIRTN